MQLKHPEILWALLLLLIPVIIHLFQLRRFKKVAFTNVKFLKHVKLQTRKSAQLKKWLTLITRLLLIAFLVFAFAQPYTTNSKSFKAKNETVIYLDNSYSMQAKGNNGSLLNEAVQDLISSYQDTENVSIFTNNAMFANNSIKSISNELLSLDYSNTQLDYKALLLKGKQLFSKTKDSNKNLVIVSDFQQKKEVLEFPKDSSIALKLVQLKPKYSNNISLDSVYVSKLTNDITEISVDLSVEDQPVKNVSVSLFNKNQLTAKTAVDITKTATTTFTLPTNNEFIGKLVIEDVGLQYDNSLYFNINETEKINVLSINKADDTFLKKLYTKDEFNYTSFNANAIDYSKIEAQNFIVLNEIKSLPTSLITTLKSFKDNGGSILIIPSSKINLNSYNQLFTGINLPNFVNELNSEKRITTISYDHPLLANAFYNSVSNFQYPKVNSYYTLVSNTNSVLKYDDDNSFLVGKANTFLFTAAINLRNSNFKKSPLIVPCLYNMAKQSLKLPELYYNIGKTNVIDVNTTLTQDEILSLELDGKNVIPLQQTFSKKVELTTNAIPSKAGVYSVNNKQNILQRLSFNFNRDESKLNYYNLENNNTYTLDNNLSTAISTIKSNASINALWKWFAIFALVFLILEMLILKYLK